MEEMKYKNAQEFIEKEFDKFFGSRDLSKFPKTLMEEFDVRNFAELSIYKDLYDILIACNPFHEFEAFYKCLNEERNEDKVKSFDFGWSENICKRYKEVNDKCDEYSEEAEKTIPIVGEPKDSTELDIVVYVDLQYDNEIKRVIELMNSLIKKGREIISTIDSISDDELEKKQVEFLILLEDVKDTSKVEPETLLNGALDIYQQLQVNILDENVVNKLCKAYE